jgi:hypothetical protein
MATHRNLKLAAAVAGSFTALCVAVIYFMLRRAIPFQLALLMLVALVGLYFGFGVLFLVYRFTSRLK